MPFTFSANCFGWTIFKNGVFFRGAGVATRNWPRGHSKAKQAKSYADYCRKECQRLNAESAS